MNARRRFPVRVAPAALSARPSVATIPIRPNERYGVLILPTRERVAWDLPLHEALAFMRGYNEAARGDRQAALVELRRVTAA